MLHACLPIEPVALGRPRFNRRTGSVYTPPECQRFKQQLSTLFKQAIGQHKPYEGPLTVHIYFDVTRPKTNKQPRHTKRPDLDNLAKAVLDALNGIAWVDDSQIWRLVCEKHYAPKEYPPSIRILVQQEGNQRD